MPPVKPSLKLVAACKLSMTLIARYQVMTKLTHIFQQIENGSTESIDQLLPLVYDELRQLAAAKMSHERADHTLGATALVHEAYLRIVPDDGGWKSRRHFFAAAAEAMRRILIDRARTRRALKRGGGAAKVAFDLNELPRLDTEDQRLVLLDEAITRLAEEHPEKAQLVKLRYFAGLTIREAAEVLGISTATADRYWAYARAWLQNAVQESEDSG